MSENLSFAVEKMTDKCKFSDKMFAKSPTKNKPKPAKPICPVGQNIWNMLQKKSYRVSIVGDCEFAES